MIAAAALACAAADDPGGWSKAKWGMTEPQLSEAFGPELNHLSVDLDLAGTPFRAQLRLDPTGKFSSALISPRGDIDASTFQSLQNLLVQKYGRPWQTEANHVTEIQWSLATTVITLSFTDIPAMDFHLLTLQYKHKTEDKI